ncbi:MAG: trans-aconitate 2-methyltransferase [Dongiaceae bacterium]
MGDWNPTLYRQFGNERERPIDDLLARIPLESPGRIVDLGCGAGASTALLRRRWPEAGILGLDSSPAMLATARETVTGAEFVEAEIGSWQADRAFDLVFSNAALQWLGAHEVLFPRLMTIVAPGGVLAVQMPRNFDAPSHRLMAETAAAGRWRDRLAGVAASRRNPVGGPAQYARLLAPLAHRCEVWETTYLLRLEGENPVVEWTRGTGLRPYLDALPEPDRAEFLAEYGRRIAVAYPKEPDGATFFPFRRLFIVASR